MDAKEKSNTTEAKKRGGRLRKCRKAVKGMTQAKLAELCDYGEKYISAFETGSRMISEKQAMLFGEKLNVNPYYLMCKTDRKTPIESKKIDPLPKLGSWMMNVDDNRRWDRVRYYCSECHDWQTFGRTKFCSNCGARMEVERR